LPSTLTGIQKYLGSGLVKRIGLIMAVRIVAKFGMETVAVKLFMESIRSHANSHTSQVVTD
jgi:hypothetical protein